MLAIASRLISFGDGERGIPPCQACHGPVAYRPGVPSLANQNADYILKQLEAFGDRSRSNDINMPMRTIAALLTEEERHALAEYYGSGLGLEPGSLNRAEVNHANAGRCTSLCLRPSWNPDAFAEARSPAYRNSSIAASSTSLPGRVSDSGSVASG